MGRKSEGSVDTTFAMPSHIKKWAQDRLIEMGCTYNKKASWGQFFKDWHAGKIKVYREVSKKSDAPLDGNNSREL